MSCCSCWGQPSAGPYMHAAAALQVGFALGEEVKVRVLGSGSILPSCELHFCTGPGVQLVVRGVRQGPSALNIATGVSTSYAAVSVRCSCGGRHNMLCSCVWSKVGPVPACCAVSGAARCCAQLHRGSQFSSGVGCYGKPCSPLLHGMMSYSRTRQQDLANATMYDQVTQQRSSVMLHVASVARRAAAWC